MPDLDLIKQGKQGVRGLGWGETATATSVWNVVGADRDGWRPVRPLSPGGRLVVHIYHKCQLLNCLIAISCLHSHDRTPRRIPLPAPCWLPADCVLVPELRCRRHPELIGKWLMYRMFSAWRGRIRGAAARFLPALREKPMASAMPDPAAHRHGAGSVRRRSTKSARPSCRSRRSRSAMMMAWTCATLASISRLTIT